MEDGAALAAVVRAHPATDSEVRLLCKDLLVLGRSEFKQLLRWRLMIKKDLQRQQKEAAKAAAAAGEAGQEGGEGEEEGEEDPEEKLLREMSEVKEQ